MEKTKVLILDSSRPFIDALSFSLQAKFNFQITQEESPTIDNIKNIIENISPKLLITDYFSEEILESIKALNLDIPIVGVNPEKFKGSGFWKTISKDKFLKQSEEILIEVFSIDEESGDEEFTGISIDLLTQFSGIEQEIYIELPTKRKLKLFSEGDNITEEDIQRYKLRNINELWIKTTAYKWVLDWIKENAEEIVTQSSSPIQVKIEGHDQKPAKTEVKNLSSFKEVFKDESETLIEEVEKEYQKEKQSDAIKLNASDNHSSNEIDEEELQKELEQLDNITKDAEKKIEVIFSEEEKFLQSLKKRTAKIMAKMNKTTSLKKCFSNLKVHRLEDKYIQSRAAIVCQIASSLAKELGWKSIATQEKLIYASFVHDLSLFNYPHLAKIRTLEQMKEMNLSSEERKVYETHIEESLKLVLEDKNAPKDIDVILKNHHELPDKTGFPKKLDGKRIPPFAAILIISLDLAQYIFDNPNWEIGIYHKQRKDKFRGGTFSKAMIIIQNLPKK